MGSVIVSRDETVAVPAIEIAELVDTTGAGDLYAAGFLFGYTSGRDLEDCGRLGSLAAGLSSSRSARGRGKNLKHEAEQAGLG